MRVRARTAAVCMATMLCGVFLAPNLPVRASGDHETARTLVESGDILSLETILDTVHQRFPGQLLEAELESEGGRLVYELEVLTKQGRVLELEYDARSGDLIKVEQED